MAEQVVRQMKPQQIAEHARRHRTGDWAFDDATPIDFSKPFLCPTLTALYYTPSWRVLSPDDQLRYTQLSALSFNEVIAWIESRFLMVLQKLRRSERVPSALRELLPDFIEDEERHQRMWWLLNNRADPHRYARPGLAITRIAPAARALMTFVLRRPLQFPVALWVTLVLEEHANEIAKRCAERRPDQIEPHFASAYLRHVRDETRHVQIDWHLIEALWPTMSAKCQAVNAWMFRHAVERLLLRTEHAAVSVVRAFAKERASVRAMLPTIERELKAVGRNEEYRQMMFSAKTAPIAHRLMERYPAIALAMQ